MEAGNARNGVSFQNGDLPESDTVAGKGVCKTTFVKQDRWLHFSRCALLGWRAVQRYPVSGVEL